MCQERLLLWQSPCKRKCLGYKYCQSQLCNKNKKKKYDISLLIYILPPLFFCYSVSCLLTGKLLVVVPLLLFLFLKLVSYKAYMLIPISLFFPLKASYLKTTPFTEDILDQSLIQILILSMIMSSPLVQKTARLWSGASLKSMLRDKKKYSLSWSYLVTDGKQKKKIIKRNRVNDCVQKSWPSAFPSNCRQCIGICKYWFDNQVMGYWKRSRKAGDHWAHRTYPVHVLELQRILIGHNLQR